MRTINIYTMEDLLNNTELFNKAYEINRLNFVKSEWYDSQWYENNTFVKSFHKILKNLGETNSNCDLLDFCFIGRFSAECFNETVHKDILETLLTASEDLFNDNKVEFCLEVSRKYSELYTKYKILVEKYENDLEFFWNGKDISNECFETNKSEYRFTADKHLFVKIFKDLNLLYMSVYNFAYECLSNKETFKEENFNSEFLEDGTLFL